MANNNYISRSKFQEVFAKALSKCNVPQDEQDKFFEEDSTLKLRNLGICIAITNIIDNSIKASNVGSWIDVEGYYGNNEYILKIKDKGIGIPQEDLDKVLEPFYMVDKARTRKNNGIGLGLSICSEICNMYNISLDIKSKLNVGTEVILIFNKEHFLHES